MSFPRHRHQPRHTWTVLAEGPGNERAKRGQREGKERGQHILNSSNRHIAIGSRPEVLWRRVLYYSFTAPTKASAWFPE